MVQSQLPYEITGDVKRFSQRYTAFSRAEWDETSAAYGKRGRSADEAAATGKAGYALEDFAMQAGAWTISRRLSGGKGGQWGC